MRRTRVLLGDDHTLVVEGLRRILESEFDVVGTAGEGTVLIRQASRLKPDVVLLDISMPGLSGIEVARRIKKENPEVKIIFLTMHSDLTYLREAFRLGASGYVVKRSAGRELISAIRAVVTGRNYVAPEIAATISDPQVRKALRRGRVPALTARQLEIVRSIASGLSNQEIATTLGITVRTVRFHRAEIARKLGISGTPALTKYALIHGIIRAPSA
jgi:DNA-binding NarL/FixJ family response regulator